ncbi:hypothetical protein HYFRA_00005120 [Hymenoscyphus fraxineus]|uniref:Uncharacterized protein n=1 Tax=Hymenoscyphus fraxineus TaxID=746836 RepID=A0A9N9Q1T5_9HELO|nr:hypothetical protein HYFRA_00005120 [Hymenoscyphus fraxineus]
MGHFINPTGHKFLFPQQPVPPTRPRTIYVKDGPPVPSLAPRYEVLERIAASSIERYEQYATSKGGDES